MARLLVLLAFAASAVLAAPPTINLGSAASASAECDGNAFGTAYANFYNSLSTITATANGCAIAGAPTVTHNAPAPAVVDVNGCSLTVNVLVSAKDRCNQTATTQLSFSGRDTVRPFFTSSPVSVTLGCEVSRANAETQLDQWRLLNGNAQGVDACDENPTISNDAPADMTPGACSFSATATFVLKDGCNNQASQSASFSYSCCTTVPTLPTSKITITGGKSETHTCSGQNLAGVFLTFLETQAGAKAVTTCPGGAVRWSNNGGTLPSVCSGEESVTFVASDDCGAQAEVTFNFKIVDVTAPVMTKKAQPGLFVCSLGKYDEANAVYQQWLASHGSATAVDTCSAELTWEHNAPANLPQQCDFSLNVAFHAFDSCGFSANTYNLFTVVGCCVVTTTTLPTTTTKPTTTTADPELAAKQGSSSGIPIYAPIVGALAGVVLVAVIAALVVRHLRNKNSSRGDEEKNSVLDDARSNASSTLSD